LLLLLLVLSLYIIRSFLLAIFVGALLAYMVYPVYLWLLKKIKNKTTSSLLICILVFLLFVIPSIFLVENVITQSYFIFVMAKQRLAGGLFENCHNSFCESLKAFGHDPTISYHVQDAIKTATNWVIERGSTILFGLPRVLLNLFIVFFTLFYFLKDGEFLLHRLNHYLSMHQEKYNIVLRRLKEIIHGVVYGYLLIAIIQGTLGGIAFFLFGVSSPLFWGAVMALLALIPYLGTGIVWVPASVIMFLNGMFQDSQFMMVKAIGLFFFCLLFVSTLDNVLRPKLIGQKAKIHPVVIMLGIFGGMFVFGPLGVIVGPLLLSLTTVFIDVYVLEVKE